MGRFFCLITIVITALFLSNPLFAGKKYWVGNGSNTFWDNTTNWSSTSAGRGGASLPTNSDTVYFDLSGSRKCYINSNVDVYRFYVGSLFTDSIVQKGFTITVGSGGFVIRGGKFSGSSSAIIVNGPFQLTTTNFKSTTGTLTISGNYTDSLHTFKHNSGKVVFTGTGDITGNTYFNKLTFSGNSALTRTFISSSSPVVNDSLLFSGPQGIVLNGGTLKARGHIYNTNTAVTGGGGTTVIKLDSTRNQVIATNNSSLNSKGAMPCFAIEKPRSSSVSLSGTITVNGTTWTDTSHVLNMSTYHSRLLFTNSLTITEKNVIDSVIFDSPTTPAKTITLSDSITVSGALQTRGTSFITFNGKAFHIKGNLTLGNSAAASAGTTTFIFSGTGAQQFTGQGSANVNRIKGVIINKPSGTLQLNSTISTEGPWTYLAGTVNPGTSTVLFYSSSTITTQNGTNSMKFNNFTTVVGTSTLGSDLDVLNQLSVSFTGGIFSTLNVGSYTINLGGRLSVSNSTTFNTGTGTVCFNGGGNQWISKTTNQNFFNFKINKSGGKVYFNLPTLTITNNMDLTKGFMATSATNQLIFADNASVSNQSDSSYVCGPVKKTGNDTFTFPLGDSTLTIGAYHGLGMTAPLSTTDQFVGQYFRTNQAYGSTLDDSLDAISTTEYWTLQRAAGTSTVKVTPTWNINSLNVSDQDILTVAQWNSSKWKDLQNESVSKGYTGNVSSYVTLDFTNGSILPILIATRKCYLQGGSDVSLCYGNSSQLSSSGATNYTWSPSIGLSSTNISNPVASPTTTTTYTVTGTYRNTLCKDYVIVTVSPDQTITFSGDAMICNGAATTITANSTASSYTWNPAAGLNVTNTATVTANPDHTTTYTITGTGSTGCIKTATKVITVSEYTIVSLSSSHVSACPNDVITLTASGASTYTWSPSIGLNATTGSSVTATNTSAQTYTVTGTATTGCKSYATVTIPIEDIILPASVDICNGGEYQIKAYGGSAYFWSPASNLSCLGCEAPVASPTSTTTYTLSVESGTRKCIIEKNIIINVHNAPTVTTSNPVGLCLGDNISLSVTASGTNTYEWTPATHLSASNISNPIVTPTENINYLVEVTNEFGCSNTIPVSILVNDISVSDLPSTINVCGSTTSSVNFTTDAQSISWSPVTGLSNPYGSSTEIYITGNTSYNITLTSGVCTESYGLIASYNTTPNSFFNYTYPGLTITFTGESGATSYSWNFGDNTTGNTQSPIHTYSTAGTYNVCLTIINACGTSTTCETISVEVPPTSCCN